MQNRNGSWQAGFTMFEAHDSTQVWQPISASGPSGVMIAPSGSETSCPRQLQLSCTVDTEGLGLVMCPPRACRLRFTLRFANNFDHCVRFAEDDCAEPTGTTHRYRSPCP